MLKVIARVLKPTKGKVEVNGTVAPLIELGAGFDFDLTGKENIYLNGALLGRSRKQMNEVVDDIIEFSELAEFMDVPMKTIHQECCQGLLCNSNIRLCRYSYRR